jgi:hypothetical protein
MTATFAERGAAGAGRRRVMSPVCARMQDPRSGRVTDEARSVVAAQIAYSDASNTAEPYSDVDFIVVMKTPLDDQREDR